MDNDTTADLQPGTANPSGQPRTTGGKFAPKSGGTGGTRRSGGTGRSRGTGGGYPDNRGGDTGSVNPGTQHGSGQTPEFPEINTEAGEDIAPQQTVIDFGAMSNAQPVGRRTTSGRTRTPSATQRGAARKPSEKKETPAEIQKQANQLAGALVSFANATVQGLVGPEAQITPMETSMIVTPLADILGSSKALAKGANVANPIFILAGITMWGSRIAEVWREKHPAQPGTQRGKLLSMAGGRASAPQPAQPTPPAQTPQMYAQPVQPPAQPRTVAPTAPQPGYFPPVQPQRGAAPLDLSGITQTTLIGD